MGKWDSNQKRHFLMKTVFTVCFLGGLVMLCVFAENRTGMQNSEVKAARRALEIEIEEAQPSLLAMLDGEEPEEESTKEIVNDSILGNVPAADYSYSFNKKLGNAKVVSRQGDYGGYNEAGAYPEENVEKSPLFTEGIEGEAIYLDGSYGIELSDIAPLADSYTIAFWFKAEELCDWSPFMIIGSNLMDVNATQNYVCFNKKTDEDGEEVVPIFNTINAVYENSCEVRPSLEDKKCIDLNKWNYITVRVDGTQGVEGDDSKVMAYLYLNSEMIGSDAVSKMCFDEGNMHTYLGINCFDRMFRACYDEVRIWNSLLDENQISNIYTSYISADS
ncbi:MAG: LamG domain-containing protein [Clostridium sp.]|nr:LamG domain-containing protein [Clostridium sp.]